MIAPPGGWAQCSVVLLKPDALDRGLAAPVLDAIGAAAEVVAVRSVIATAVQVYAHYADLFGLPFGFDVGGELRRVYAGRRVAVALAHGTDSTTAARLRALIGHYDPSRAGPSTIRGRFGTDTAARARTEHRLVRNLIHTSDDPAGAEREFRIWFGPAYAHLPPRRPVETR